MGLEIQRIEAALKSAVDSIRKTPAVKRHKNVLYAVVVKVGYEEIKALRNDGYSYEVICKMLSENGALDVGASPKNLCTAFLREAKRRLSQTHASASNSVPNKIRAQTEKVIPAAANPNKDARNKGGEEKETDEEEWKRKMPKSVVHTGTGEIIKRPDGGFDY